MSFGGFGSSGAGGGSSNGGFGQNNNNQNRTGFGGGFGQQNTQNSGFGGSGFGSSNTGQSSGTNLFGGTSGATSGFGGGGGTGATTSGGFGANTSSAFGSKPFASTNTGGGLFGANNNASSSGTPAGGGGFGGFGASNTNNTTSAFGGGNTGGSGLFGSSQGDNKPGFGATGGNTGGSMFGGGQTGGFGANAPTFNSAVPTQCEGTGSVPFQAHTEKETSAGQTITNHFQSINFMQPYQKFSFEELRLADYAQGRRYGNGNNQAGAFGTNTGFGGFGAANTTGTGTGGGFGQQNTGAGGSLFGGTSGASSSPFGGGQTAGGFGASNTNTNTNAGAGLFGGQNKPAGSLFSTQNNQNQPGQSNSLFGGQQQQPQPQQQQNTTSSPFGGSGGFGQNNQSNQGTTGGSLFGQSNQQQNKPGFSFATSNTNNNNNTGFGASNQGGFGQTPASTGGSLFGQNNNTATSGFGGGQQQQNQQGPGGLFGSFGQPQNQNQNQQNAGTGFGGSGNNDQNKQSGFGGSTGSSLFGNNQNQQTPGFGGNQNQSSGSSLFGNKPFGGTPQNTGGGGSLFGGQNNQQGGGSLFGTQNNQNNQSTGGSLFGNANQQQQQQRPSLFGGSTNTGNNSGGLFSNAPSNTGGGGSLFGTSNTQNQPQQSGSLFGGGNNSFQQSQPQQQQQTPQGLSTSITDLDPFGSFNLFNGLNNLNAENAGPIATPLSSSQKQKKSALLPHYKLNPSSASRMITPQKRGGYGFSYSTYGTPGSAISSTASTPMGLSSSLLGTSLGRGLGKSLSTSNLRRTYDTEDSVLSPNAFSASSNRSMGAGSLKKLNINRGIRGDLFSPKANARAIAPGPAVNGTDQAPPNSLKKRVSFDTNAGGGPRGLTDRGDLPNGTSATPSAEEQGLLRSSSLNGDKRTILFNGTSDSDASPSKGNELAVVHEDETPSPETIGAGSPSKLPMSHEDKAMGEYWMKPSRREVESMPRDKKKHLAGFVIGRHGCGSVHFDAPVDLTVVNLDQLLGTIAVIVIRSATVYPEDVAKPPVGRGLNVPSTIRLDNSWPRGKGGRKHSYETTGTRFAKHIDRLSKVPGTHFKSYDKTTGTWEFTVDHFTTYGMDYDSDDSDDEDTTQSVLGPAVDSPTSLRRVRGVATQATSSIKATPGDSSLLSTSSDEEDQNSNPDDTFDFKKKSLSGKGAPPGAFDREEIHEEDEIMDDEQYLEDEQSFLGEGSAEPASESDAEEPEEMEEASEDLQDPEPIMIQDSDDESEHHLPEAVPTGPEPHETVNISHEQEEGQDKNEIGAQDLGTPSKPKWALSTDWAQHLQKSISPRKQDRELLRQSQANLISFQDMDRNPTPRASKTAQPETFATSIDLMNSLFNRSVARPPGNVAKKSIGQKGFEV